MKFEWMMYSNLEMCGVPEKVALYSIAAKDTAPYVEALYRLLWSLRKIERSLIDLR